ncbi:MAG TPA: BatA domain-containing protein, partial [Gemmatimonadaceae bacterium]|nr:BatA domain-containing protein [Gemmatimonadaceae bacterium]
MTFLAPLWLALAGVAAAGVVALHLIASRRPPSAPFPTARFVPEGDARAVTRTARPADLLLLAIRASALLLLGAAFARPVLRLGGVTAARVVVVDRSRSALADAGDSARALWRPGDGLVLFDSSARRIISAEADSLRHMRPVGARGALSPALIAAIRAARAIAPRADSAELILVSPVTLDEVDSATSVILAQWRGRIRVIRTAAATPVVPVVTLESSRPDDGLRPAIAALAAGTAVSGDRAIVRVIRHPPVASDSAAALEGSAVVHWPEAHGTDPHASGVWAGNVTLVAPLWSLPLAGTGRAVARWADGRPAAFERAFGRGCMRTVGVGPPFAGDVALQPSFVALARQLLGP